jgi:hypothetical protein
MGDRHERGHFLVPRLDEVDAPLTLQGADYTVDAITRVAEDPFDAPGFQSFHEKVGCFHASTTPRSDRCSAAIAMSQHRR